MNPMPRLDRRDFLLSLPTAAALVSLGKATPVTAQATRSGKPTNFQIACMTLPYSQFPLQRALEGIARSGFKYVALGTRHLEAPGRQVPVLDMDAKPAEAKKVGDRCRDLGMTPVLMFSTVYVEAPDGLDAHKKKIEQAAAAGIPQLLTFGHTEGGKLDVWVKNLKILGPLARSAGVTVVIKQHGGETGTGEACAKIVREVADPGVWMNYDAGNVMDYLDVDPLPDIRKCIAEIRSFCIKDHRNVPEGRRLRTGAWGNRSLQTSSACGVHRSEHAARLRKHFSAGIATAKQAGRCGRPGDGGLASSWRS